MTYQELVAEIDRLTSEEQVSLLAHLQHALQTKATAVPTQSRGTIEHWRGVLATGGPPPTDQEIENILVAALLEKYS